MASRLSSLPAITIGSEQNSVQGSKQLQAQAGARKVKSRWGSVHCSKCRARCNFCKQSGQARWEVSAWRRGGGSSGYIARPDELKTLWRSNYWRPQSAR